MYKVYVLAFPYDKNSLSLGALKALQGTECIVLKQNEPKLEAFLQEESLAYISLDSLWDSCDSYETLHARMADKILELAKTSPVLYCVADSLFDSSVKILKKKTDLEIIPSLSLFQYYMASLPLDGLDEVLCVSASDLMDKRIHPKQNIFISELGDTLLAGQVKLLLGDLYDDEMTVHYFSQGKKGMLQKEIPLFELDMQEINPSSAVFVKGQEFLSRNRFDYEDLLDIVAVLRGPNGCPWDRRQTHESLREFMLEESHELVGAITAKDLENTCEELGDVLLQVALHGNIAEENGEFRHNDVTSAISKKMIERHVHVFGEKHCETPEEVLKSWEEIKKKEKGLDSVSESMLQVSKALPSLMRAEKVQNKAAKAGLDFANLADAASKVREELEELLEAVQNHAENAEEELGDLLFSVVNVARFAKLNPDVSLTFSTEKFINRFRQLENLLKVDKKSLKDLTLEELDVYWNIGKAVLKD